MIGKSADGKIAGAMTMRIEWMRAGDSTPTCWACFEIYDDRVRVLALLSTGLIDRDMTLAAARSLWTDLKLQGWYRASEAELNHHQMSHRTLRRMAYGRR
jgi:hypothetical protein